MGSEPNASNRIGDLLQGKKYCNGKQDNCAYPSGSDRNIGMVRGGNEQGLEKSISDHSFKHQRGRSSNGSSSVGANSQSMVEVPHGHPTGVLGGCRDVE